MIVEGFGRCSPSRGSFGRIAVERGCNSVEVEAEYYAHLQVGQHTDYT